MKKWWIAGAAVVLVTAVALTVVLTRGEGTAEAAPSTTKVARGDVNLTVSAAGTIQAQASRSLGFSSTGTVTEVNVKAGDNVTPGQELAKIDSTSAQDAVTNAQKAVDSAEDAVDNAQDELDAAKATPSTCPSTSAAQPRTSGSAQASASPKPQASTCSTGNQQQQRTSSNGGADALFSAQQKLNNAKLTLQQAQTKLDGTTIEAPIAGKILSVAAGVGASGGSAFIVLAGSDDVTVKAQFTEAEVAKLAVNQAAKITMSDQARSSFTGKVLTIDPAGTVSNRLVRYGAVIAFDTVPTTLLYGQTANVAVTTSSARNVLYVPSTAISGRSGDSGTVSVKIGSTIERRKITLGLRGDVNTEVKSGLNQGDAVLTSAAT
jgi:multidrug efflux pump subunit AcrA (membrane-fusion protein)